MEPFLDAAVDEPPLFEKAIVSINHMGSSVIYVSLS
jgi:hypothetical protein